jgi:hypothetical protein
VWTTVATGQPPDVHGVHGIETRRLVGVQGAVQAARASRVGTAMQAATDLLRLTAPSIASGIERRQKTMWEVAADAGLRTAVVNWWATWPAPADRGPHGPIVLTDRATLRLERGGALDAEIAPAALYESLRSRWPSIRDEAARLATTALAGTPSRDSEIQTLFVRSAQLDAMQLILAREISSPAPDLLAVYLPGLDIAQHAIMGAQEREGFPASTVSARLQALEDYYVALDRLLERVLPPMSGEIVMVVTQPGRIGAPGDSLLRMAGSSVRARTQVRGRDTDVMPTILHALGVPLSSELAGSPLLQLMSDDFVRRHPPRHVTTYGRPASAVAQRQGEPLDQEMLERLRSLGYVR